MDIKCCDRVPLDGAQELDLVRLGADMLGCVIASLIGVWRDGLFPFSVVQSYCIGGSVSVLSTIRLHLLILPNTSLMMLAVAILCLRSSGPSAGALDRAIKNWCRYIAKLTFVYSAMLLSMGLGQDQLSFLFSPSPFAAALSALLGMLVLILIVQFLRILPHAAASIAHIARRARIEIGEARTLCGPPISERRFFALNRRATS